MILKEFIEVTSVYDGKKAAIRAACIDSVIEYPPQDKDFGVKPEHRKIVYSGFEFDAVESYDEICDMIYNAEL